MASTWRNSRPICSIAPEGVNELKNEVIRSVVTILLGLLVTLGVRLGYHVSTTEAAVVLTGLVTAGYAVVAHAVEHVVPGLGKYLTSLGLAPKAK